MSNREGSFFFKVSHQYLPESLYMVLTQPDASQLFGHILPTNCTFFTNWSCMFLSHFRCWHCACLHTQETGDCCAICLGGDKKDRTKSWLCSPASSPATQFTQWPIVWQDSLELCTTTGLVSSGTALGSCLECFSRMVAQSFMLSPSVAGGEITFNIMLLCNNGNAYLII